MDRAELGLNIPHKGKLNNEEKDCYLSKVGDIDGLDPYELTDWTDDDFDLPPLTHPMQYLIEGTSYNTFNSLHSESLEIWWFYFFR